MLNKNCNFSKWIISLSLCFDHLWSTLIYSIWKTFPNCEKHHQPKGWPCQLKLPAIFRLRFILRPLVLFWKSAWPVGGDTQQNKKGTGMNMSGQTGCHGVIVFVLTESKRKNISRCQGDPWEACSALRIIWNRTCCACPAVKLWRRKNSYTPTVFGLSEVGRTWAQNRPNDFLGKVQSLDFCVFTLDVFGSILMANMTPPFYKDFWIGSHRKAW